MALVQSTNKRFLQSCIRVLFVIFFSVKIGSQLCKQIHSQCLHKFSLFAYKVFDITTYIRPEYFSDKTFSPLGGRGTQSDL